MSPVATFECETVGREFQFVGQCATGNFPASFPETAIKVQTAFVPRRSEISGVINPEVLYSPYMCNGPVATYFACSEVEEVKQVPEGMLGFKVAFTDYAKISCSNKTVGEGYSKLFEWIQTQGHTQKSGYNSTPIEIYYFEDDVEEEVVELLIPIEEFAGS